MVPRVQPHPCPTSSLRPSNTAKEPFNATRSSPMNILHLDRNQPGRRAGLTRGYTGERLLKTINAPAKVARNDMAPRTTNRPKAEVQKEPVRKVEEDDESIFRPPQSIPSSDDEENGNIAGLPDHPDSSDDERDRIKADIKPTKFGPAEGKPKLQTLKGRAAARGKSTEKGPENGNATTRSAGKRVSPISRNTSSPKRKSREDAALQGTAIRDVFGNIKSSANKKKRTIVYGSSQSSRMTSSQVTVPKSTPNTGESPKQAFKTQLIVESPQKSDTEDRSNFQPQDASLLKSPSSTPAKERKFIKTRRVPDTPSREPSSAQKFRVGHLVSSPQKDDDEEAPAFKVLGLDESFELPDIASPMSSTERPSITRYDMPATQHEPFKAYDIEALTGKAKDILQGDADGWSPISTALIDDDFATQTQQAVCPMCKVPVDPDKLKAYGVMNTRMQEKFCRMHQKKTAEEYWDSRGYPEIDWENLDSRISGHHKFIKKLINGADSHYRRALIEKVDAGKDRSLMKMTSNLTPGYYGSRGLQTISENIMHTFTPLLKKRMVKDRLMSARGFTGYVQAVLVPEVTVLLIMEDMTVGIEEARGILSDSAGVGELLQEEVRDVVKKIEDSDDEDELAD